MGTAARLSLSALTAGVADPRDWAGCRHPSEFLQATLRRWLAAQDLESTEELFNLAVTLGDSLHPDSRPQKATDPFRAFLTIEPTGAAFCACAPTLQLLDRVHPRLPITFYRRLRDSVLRIIRVYDYQDARDHVQLLRDCLDEEEAEQAEIPDVDRATPASLAAQPLPWRRVRPLIAHASRTVRALFAALDAVTDACRPLRPLAQLPRDVDDVLECCDPPLPCLLLVFRADDPIEGCFEAEMQEVDPYNQIPTAFLPITIADPKSVRRAFAGLTAYCRLFVALSHLIHAMPGHTGEP